MKRFIDIVISSTGLLAGSPFFLLFMYLVYRQDKKSPFYIAPRIGKDGKLFKMIKLRSMSVNADKTGVDSTSADDARITPIGEMIRKYKLDEFTQLFNVLIGDMSLVGPRPNVKKGGTDLYTIVENRILTIRPGITDFSSIIFSDEGEILKDSKDPDLMYNQLIRPWKSRLCLIYIEHQSTWLDLKLVVYTVVAIFSKKIAIKWLVDYFQTVEIDPLVTQVVKRENELFPYPPPGMKKIVASR